MTFHAETPERLLKSMIGSSCAVCRVADRSSILSHARHTLPPPIPLRTIPGAFAKPVLSFFSMAFKKSFLDEMLIFVSVPEWSYLKAAMIFNVVGLGFKGFKVGGGIIHFVSVFVVNYVTGVKSEVCFIFDYLARQAKSVAVFDEWVNTSVEPKIKAFAGAEVVKGISELASYFFYGFLALCAFGLDLCGNTLFCIYTLGIKNSVDSHTGNVVGFGNFSHRDKIDGIGFNDIGILSGIDFHGVSFV